MRVLQPKASPNKTQVITKALFNTKKELGISNAVIGQIIGADAATISRMQKNMDMKENKVYEAAVLLVRIYRSLFSILGGSADAMKHWLFNGNKDFNGTAPIEVMKTMVGLVNVVEYLDAMRGHA